MKQANEERELTRLLNEAGSGLGEHVAALREHVPNAVELGALASSLTARGIAITPRAPSATSPTWKKWAAGGAGGAAAVALWLALAARGVGPAGPSSASPTPTLDVHASPPALTASSPTVSLTARAIDPTTEATVEPSPSANATAAPLPEATVPAAPIPKASGADLPTSPPEPTAKPFAKGSHGPESRFAPVTGPTPPSGDAATQPSELELLRDARLAIRSSPAAALGLVDRHSQLYPQGKLTQERELIAISALVAMGRRTAALSRAASFERSFPGSAYRKQVEELLR